MIVWEFNHIVNQNGALFSIMLVLVPKNVQISNDVIRDEFMRDYDSEMDTADNAYSTFGSKKGDWVTLKKNIFSAVHFNVDKEFNDNYTTIVLHEGGTKVGNFFGADLWGTLFYGSFFKDVQTNFIYWLKDKYGLNNDEIKLQNEPFLKSLLVLVVILVFEYIISFEFDAYEDYFTIALVTIVLFIPLWLWSKRYNSKIASETGIEVLK